MGLGISAHGTIIARAPAATPTVFTDIGELMDITLPDLMRNSSDTTTHNDDIDQFIMGVLRRGELQFTINFIASGTVGSGHNHLTGLYRSIIDHEKDGWRVSFPDGDVWVFSGGVANISKRAPVDGPLTCDVRIRPSGRMYIGNVLVGDL
jgi:hypothetical protein